MSKRSRRKRDRSTAGPKPAVLALKYVDDANARRVGRLRWRLLTVLLVLAAARVLIVQFGDRAWNAALARFWQARCLSYQLPSDRIAYLAAPRGLQFPNYLGDFSDGSSATWSGTVAAMPYPVELAEFHHHASPQQLVSWDRLPGPVFLHGLKDQAGKMRLLTVYVLVNNPAGWWTLVAMSREAASTASAPNNPVVTTASWPMAMPPDASLVVFAGQPDPRNESRFSVRIRLNGQEQLVTGKLLTGGHVDFTSSTGLTPWDTRRTGPIVVPAPPSANPADPHDNVFLPTD